MATELSRRRMVRTAMYVHRKLLTTVASPKKGTGDQLGTVELPFHGIDYDVKGLHPSRQRKRVRGVRTQRMITYVDHSTSILKVTCHI